MNGKRKVIGIDFGSTQSSIAIMEIGKTDSIQLFTFDESSSPGDPMQTVLLLDNNDESVIAIGNKVKDRADAYPQAKFISNFKCLLENGSEESKAAERYTGMFLKEMREQVQKAEGVELSSADYATCIACPAAWKEPQVERLRQLVEEAGFPPDGTRGVYVLKEPVAAMRAHMIDFAPTLEYFLVMDFGGGTLDICIVETGIGGQDPRVLGVAGDAKLGGHDFDRLLLEHLEMVYKDKGLRYEALSSANQYKLDSAIRDAKQTLSDNFLGKEKGGPITATVKWPGICDLKLSIDQEVFMHLVKEKHIDARIRTCIRAAIADSGVPVEKITRAVLTGGSSRWFFVRDIVCEECKLVDDDNHVIVSQTPFTDVAMGCALSKGRMGGQSKRNGLWVKWRFEDETDWRGPKELLKAGRANPSPGIIRQGLGDLHVSRFWKPYRIELSFWEGEEGAILTPYKDGRSAVIDFYARSNHPLLKRPKDIYNAARGRLGKIDQTFQDIYQCFLLCKEYPSGAVDFKLQLRDRAAYLRGDVSIDWEDKKLVEVAQGMFSRCGWFGFGRRKVVKQEDSSENK